MESDRLTDEICDVNVAFLELAQHLIRENRSLAMLCLGIGGSVADSVSSLSAARLARIADSRTLLCRFRFGEASYWNQIAGAALDTAARESALATGGASPLPTPVA